MAELLKGFPVLSVIVFLPLAGGLVCLALEGRPNLVRRAALLFALADLGLAASLLTVECRPLLWNRCEWLFSESHPWIPAIGARYSLGLDGVNLPLVVLTAFLGALSVLASWREINVLGRVGAFHFFLLWAQTCILGVFLATDLFLFYLFWELQIIPLFFIVGIWGHAGRVRAAVKFALFTAAGSLAMLLGLAGLWYLHGLRTGVSTFALADLLGTPLAPEVELRLFTAFLVAFAVKVPVVPLHVWLPDAHTEAPTAGSVILAGLLLKTGAYSLLRFAFPLFPGAAASLAPLLVALGVTGLLYASVVAAAQRNLKRMVAYSSIGHMALVVIGLAVWEPQTVTGAVLQMVNHGLTTPALFILVQMVDRRVHSHEFRDLGGLWAKAPALGAFFLLFAMASLGLPGLNNFVGEMLILMGAFPNHPWAAVLGFAAMALVLVYVTRMVQESLFGPLASRREFGDLTLREGVILSALALAVLWMALRPGSVLTILDAPVGAMIGGR